MINRSMLGQYWKPRSIELVSTVNSWSSSEKTVTSGVQSYQVWGSYPQKTIEDGWVILWMGWGYTLTLLDDG